MKNYQKIMLAFKRHFAIILAWIGGLAPDQKTKKELLMSTSYTPAMVARITAAAPLNLAIAKDLASEFGNVTYRSVIAKAKSLGVEYAKAEPAARKAKSDEPTKADVLGAIRLALALPERDGDLTKAELSAVLANLG